MALEKRISFRHGVSEKGNLQAYQVWTFFKDGEEIDEKIGLPYRPKDVKNMEGFDKRSKEVVAAITTKEAKVDFEAEKSESTGSGLEEIVTHDRMIDDLERISIRQITRIFDSGVEVSKKYHRTWLMPGDDSSNADAMSKALAKKFHTPEVIAAYRTMIAETG